ncbi:MAG: hypothetical protein JJE19_08805 [Methanosarcinales archaeon]|nr:hypothetical protein [Methanosarcinales archaeon]
MAKYPFGLVMIFGCLVIIMYFGLGVVSVMDEEINETNLSAPLHSAYNVTTEATQMGLTLGSILPFLTAAIFVIAICLFILRKI